MDFLNFQGTACFHDTGVENRLTHMSAVVILAFASFLGKSVLLEYYQVFADETKPQVVRRPDKRKRPFRMADIGIYGAAVDSEETGGLTYRVGPFRENF